MPTISNLTDRPVLLAFNSGRTLRLSPRSQSEDIPDVELNNNAKVAKLAASHVIAVDAPATKRRGAAASSGAAAPANTSAKDASRPATPSMMTARPTPTSSKGAAKKSGSDKSERSAKRPE